MAKEEHPMLSRVDIVARLKDAAATGEQHELLTEAADNIETLRGSCTEAKVLLVNVYDAIGSQIREMIKQEVGT
jgi:hypothetical protein